MIKCTFGKGLLTTLRNELLCTPISELLHLNKRFHILVRTLSMRKPSTKLNKTALLICTLENKCRQISVLIAIRLSLLKCLCDKK